MTDDGTSDARRFGGRALVRPATTLKLADERGEFAQGGTAVEGARQVAARDGDLEAVFDGDDDAEQNQGREGNHVVERLVLVAAADGRGERRVGRGAQDEFAQFGDGLGGVYGCLRGLIWTSPGEPPPCAMTGAGETGSASGKKRSSLCR